MSRQCRRFILATELLLLAAGLFSCSSQRDHDEEFRQELETLEKKTVPPDAVVPPSRGPFKPTIEGWGKFGAPLKLTVPSPNSSAYRRPSLGGSIRAESGIWDCPDKTQILHCSS